MLIPELPFINLSFKARCPACAEKMGGHLVRDRFTCPFCHSILKSNKKETINTAVIIAIVLYLLFALAINFISMKDWILFMTMIAASFAPILIGYTYFKMYFKVVQERSS